MQSADANAAALDYLKRLAESHFWGALEIRFENGRAVLLRKSETIRPVDSAANHKFDDNRRNTRGECDGDN